MVLSKVSLLAPPGDLPGSIRGLASGFIRGGVRLISCRGSSGFVQDPAWFSPEARLTSSRRSSGSVRNLSSSVRGFAWPLRSGVHTVLFKDLHLVSSGVLRDCRNACAQIHSQLTRNQCLGGFCKSNVRARLSHGSISRLVLR